jgi:hypothetical protein
LEDERFTYTLERMQELGALEGEEPDLSQLVNRDPASQAVESLGAWEGDPRWH